eukprot:1191136-Prorocentrum_minimum.AAC.4
MVTIIGWNVHATCTLRAGKRVPSWKRCTLGNPRLLLSLIVASSVDHRRKTVSAGGDKAPPSFPCGETRRECAARVLQILSADLPETGTTAKISNVTDDLANGLHLAPADALPPLPAPLQRLCKAMSDAETDERYSTLKVKNAKQLLLQALSAKPHKVPDVEGASLHQCTLTRSTCGRRFVSREVNIYFASVFEAAIATAAEVGADFTLSRFDLFHGHMFLSARGTLGVLLHAQEYPAFEEGGFPVHLGYCQVGSPLQYEIDNMNFRNILWTTRRCRATNQPEKQTYHEGVLSILDTAPGSPLYEQLIMEGLTYVRTVDESDFGYVLADVNYFHSLINRKPEHRVFVHPV